MLKLVQQRAEEKRDSNEHIKQKNVIVQVAEEQFIFHVKFIRKW